MCRCKATAVVQSGVVALNATIKGTSQERVTRPAPVPRGKGTGAKWHATCGALRCRGTCSGKCVRVHFKLPSWSGNEHACAMHPEKGEHGERIHSPMCPELLNSPRLLQHSKWCSPLLLSTLVLIQP